MPKTSNGGGQNQSPLEQNRTRSQKYLAHFSTFTKNHKFLCIFIALYCVFLVAFSRYAPNLDDLPYFSYIYQNEINFFTGGGGNPKNGRFYPFAFLDLLILMKISTSPYLFFSVNAFLFALFCVIYIKILDLSNGKSALNSAIVVLVSLSFGFVIVFFGICYPEKIQIIWLSIFMLCSFCVIRDLSRDSYKDSGKSNRFTQIFGILSLNIALYYKEPSFIAAFAFGVVLLIYALQNRQKDLAKYALYILLSALIYALLYVLLVLVFNEISSLYTKNVEGTILREFVGCVLNDSLVIFAVGGILLYRIYAVLIKKARIEPFFDGLLAGSLAYFSVFVALKMYAPYYILPCFVLGMPSLLYFGRKYFHNLFIKICLILGLFGFFTQNLPSGIYKMIDLKAQGVQYHRTLDFTASYLKANQNAEIYFQGIGQGYEIYGEEATFAVSWFEAYLRIFHNVHIDLRTNAPIGTHLAFGFNIYEGTPKPNDLIVVNNLNAYADSLSIAGQSGELIFQSGFHTIPYFALLPFVKYISVKYFSANLWGKNTNFFRMPTETYIFKVR